MADRSDITPELCRQLLRYEPETGKLFWLPRPASMFNSTTQSPNVACGVWNARFAGEEAFITLNDAGYRYSSIHAIKVRAHRVIWMMQTGEDIPEGMLIDHINGVRDDNRWVNLRLASRSQNNHNRHRTRSDSISGIRGVKYRAERDRYVAVLRVDGRERKFGSFRTAAEAHARFLEVERQYRGENASCLF